MICFGDQIEHLRRRPCRSRLQKVMHGKFPNFTGALLAHLASGSPTVWSVTNRVWSPPVQSSKSKVDRKSIGPSAAGPTCAAPHNANQLSSLCFKPKFGRVEHSPSVIHDTHFTVAHTPAWLSKLGCRQVADINFAVSLPLRACAAAACGVAL